MSDIADIIVTTPKKMMAVAAKEAEQCREYIDSGGWAFYFRTFRSKPKQLGGGSRIYYVEDGYVRGFGTVAGVFEGEMACEVTDMDWGEGYHAIMYAETWEWVEPIPMKGFQGWRYFTTPRKDLKIVGDWRDPKPDPDDFQ